MKASPMRHKALRQFYSPPSNLNSQFYLLSSNRLKSDRLTSPTGLSLSPSNLKSQTSNLPHPCHFERSREISRRHATLSPMTEKPPATMPLNSQISFLKSLSSNLFFPSDRLMSPTVLSPRPQFSTLKSRISPTPVISSEVEKSPTTISPAVSGAYAASHTASLMSDV